MKKLILSLGLVIASISALFAQVPMATEDVMLQAFYWNSHGETKWSQLNSQASEIAASFDLIWLPPASAAEGGGGMNMGYHPYQWHNLTSSWGNQAQLTTLIKSLKAGGCKAVADIVVNHRAGNSANGDFPQDNFGTYGTFKIPNSCITKDDERSNSSATDFDYKHNVQGDMWGGYAAARDLAHSKSEVRNAVKGYLKWLKNTIGFEGFRYDLVKGYDPKYTAEYNTAAAPYFSVGEFYQSNYDDLAGWVNGTSKKSTVFDFCFKQAMYDWGGGSNYEKLAWMDGSTKRPAGLIHNPGMRQYAVTFIDNHDTATPHEGAWEYGGDVEKANAVMLSAPGIPCVFWKHWKTNKAAIKKMIACRKQMGVNSNSDVKVTNTSGYYESVATGTKGSLICRVGSWSGTPSGYTQACSGNGWAYYTNKPVDFSNTGNTGNTDTPVTKTDITIKVKAPSSWTQCYLWAWDSSDNNLTNAGEWPGTTAMTKNADGTFSYTVKNVPGTLNFLFNDGKSGGEQTADESTTSNSCWTIGSKNASNENKYDLSQNSSCDLAPSPKPNPNPNPNPTPNPDGSITLRVKASSIPWGDKCYIYTWDGGELGAEVKYSGEWPGTAMTLGSDGYYTYTIKQSMVYAIFNNGASSGTLQTDDIQNITASTCYEIVTDNEHENMLGASVYDAVETNCPAQTAVIEAEAAGMVIYPNPTNDYIYINCDEAIEEVVINAINGSEVIRTKSNEIDLSSLNPSIYFVNIMLQNGDVVRSKVIRK